MPELPEVETIKKDLRKNITGRTIKSIRIFNKSTLRDWPANYRRMFIGQKIKSVDRRAKLILFFLSQGDVWVVHLKMTGQIVLKSRLGLLSGGHPIVGVDNVPNKFTRLMIELSGGLNIYFNDVRKFGYWQFIRQKRLPVLLNKYGPEPLGPSLTTKKLAGNLSRRLKSTIKAALLDQSIVAGLGNIYVDETLFLAGLRPERRVASLKQADFIKLTKSIKVILKKSLIARGTSFSNYLDAVGRPGSYWQQRLVYGRSGQACRRCHSVIIKSRVAGRGTHWCPICQK